MLAIITLLALTGAVQAQDTPPPAPVKATIADAAWLSGRWTGEGMGGRLDEGFADPVGGQMAGYFTLSRGGKPVFHEMILLIEHEGSLRLRVKHFGPDFIGWEEKDRFLDFPLVTLAPGELGFRGMVFRRDGPDRMTLTIRFKSADGAGRDEVLRYRRIP